MFHRLIKPLKTNSFFMFGARGTGKSTYVREQFLADDVFRIDLLKPELEDLYIRNPSYLEKELLSLKERPEWVFLDEVQKVPKLLNLVHKLIEEEGFKFILSGSSARKLKRGSANLLAGRALMNNLYPLSFLELKEDFDLVSYLQWGGLPSVWMNKDPLFRKEYLKSYALTYVKEEIQTEQVLRRLDPFRSFLPIAAQMSGKIINHKSIADEVGVDIKTVQSYFKVLEETYLGFYLNAYHTSVRKSQKLQPKFYIFDLGLRNALANSLDSQPSPSTSYYGDLFEQFIFLEAKKLNDYFRKDYEMSYFSTKNNLEVDLVLSKPKEVILVEIKSSDKINETNAKKLSKLSKDFKGLKQAYYISQYEDDLTIEGVRCCHWQRFFSEVFEA